MSTRWRDLSPEAVVTALAAPVLFLHIKYQPTWELSIGSTTAAMTLSDVAALTIVAAGLAAGRRRGFGPLRRGRIVLMLSGAFVALVFAATLYPLAWQDDYRTQVHLVSAAKLAEYALLVVAIPLALRTRADAYLVFATLTAWSAAATLGAVLQFLGVLNELEGRRPGQREPSFVGIHDLAALSGAVLSLTIAAVALGPLADRRQRVVAATAGVSGALGLVLSAAAAGVAGVVAAIGAATLLAFARGGLTARRLAALAAITGCVGLGALAMRSVDFPAALEHLGIERAETSPRVESESYRQRLLLAYIGVRTFLDHPLIGVGWQGTSEEENYAPYLADAHRRYPKIPDVAFPSPDHPWGIQNAYIQAAAELGIVGLLLFLSLFAAGIAVAVRAVLRARASPVSEAVPILWLLVTMGVWIGLGLVVGIPQAALQWLSLGLAVAAANWVEA